MPILGALYLLSAALLAIYGLNVLPHVCVYWLGGGPSAVERVASLLDDDRLPLVTVQLPIYNERHVAARLIDAVAGLDWPADRLHVQVWDDSTDDTTVIVAAALSCYRERGRHVEHVHQPSRIGYKAGASAVSTYGAHPESFSRRQA